MKYFLTVLSIIMCFVISGCGTKQSTQIKSITGIEAASKQQQGAVILDVRELEEYQSGHIPNSILIPYQQITEQELQQKKITKETILIVYCRSGNRSHMAASTLIHLGYQNVFDLGSIDNWVEELEK